MSTIRPLLLILVSLFAFTGCATQKPLKELDLGSNRWKGTAILLNYRIEKADAEILKTGCSLYLVNVADGKEYHVALDANRSTVLFEAPAGEYEGKLLYCSSQRAWSLERFLHPAIQLVPNKINYAGLATFRFTDDGSGLTNVASTRKESAQALIRNFNEMHPAWSRSVVSAFTKKPITKAMLTSASDYKMSVKLTLGSKEDASPSEALQSKLRACEESETSVNPAPIGQFAMHTKFEGGKLSEAATDKADHSFSDAFPKCVEESLKGLTPSTSGKLEASVAF